MTVWGSVARSRHAPDAVCLLRVFPVGWGLLDELGPALGDIIEGVLRGALVGHGGGETFAETDEELQPLRETGCEGFADIVRIDHGRQVWLRFEGGRLEPDGLARALLVVLIQ